MFYHVTRTLFACAPVFVTRSFFFLFFFVRSFFFCSIPPVLHLTSKMFCFSPASDPALISLPHTQYFHVLWVEMVRNLFCVRLLCLRVAS